jgi:hypothetical protein
MTERKLTPDQIDELYTFCRKHYVNQYDLQIELVDHMASSVEEQWETSQRLSFQEALNNTFGKFGIFGFSKIKEQKEKELRRKYNHLFFLYLIDFYRWPKFLLTLTLSILLYTLFRLTNNVPMVTVGLTMLIAVSLIFYHFYLFEKYFDVKVSPKKSFLILDCLRNRQVMVSAMFQLPWFISQVIREKNYNYINHPEIEFAIAFFLIGLSLVLYLYFIAVPLKIKEHFTEQFPQFIQS